MGDENAAQTLNFAESADNRAEVAYTFRDWRQSLMEMLPSISYLARVHPNSGKLAKRIQSGGGTDWDRTAAHGRVPAEDVQNVMGAHKDNIQEALWRGIVGLGYAAQHPSVHKPMLRLFANAGLNVVQNFHGLNDPEFTDPIDQPVRELHEEEEYNIWSAAVLSIEDNINYDEDKLIEYAKHRINEMGCKEIYLKSASGRVNPDATRSLVDRLMQEFPVDVPIKLHAHDTYGEAIPYYIAAAEAAAKHGRKIIVDGLHDAVSGNTAQPSMFDIQMAFEMHPDPAVRAMAPKFTDEQIEAHEADRIGLLETRARFWEAEAGFDAETLDYMYICRCPGGADAALKKMVGNQAAFRDYQWEDVKRLIFKTQAKIDGHLGGETQITPFARMQNLQAASSLGVILEDIKRQNPGASPQDRIKIAEQRVSELNLETADNLRKELSEIDERGYDQATKAQIRDLLQKRIAETDPIALIMKEMHPAAKGYLAGKLGKVPESTNQDLVDFAEQALANAPTPEPPSYDEAKRWLIEDKILPPEAANDDFEPTDDQEWSIVMAATLWDANSRERGRTLVNSYHKGTNVPASVPDFPDHLKTDVFGVLGTPAEVEQIAQHAMNIARAEYHTSRIGRLQVEEENNQTAGKQFWTKFHAAKIDKCEEGIESSMDAMLDVLREAHPQNRDFVNAVKQLNLAIQTQCKKKGLSGDNFIPTIGAPKLRQYGVTVGPAAWKMSTAEPAPDPSA